MKNLFLSLLMMGMTLPASACSGNDSPAQEEDTSTEVTGRTILVTYFSWGGNTKQVAEKIAEHTGGTLFRIETVTPYPTDYTECTVVARQEKDNGVRPALKTRVEDIDQYDTIFVGCPVWWWTAPMAIVSFLEDTGYDFSDKTVIPFCTYESTYRDETLAKIVELTPDSKHLKGFGTTDKDADVTAWLTEIGIAVTSPAEPESPEEQEEPETAKEGTIDMSQTVNSEILGGAQRYTIYLPPSYNSNPDRSYPVLYLLQASHTASRKVVYVR
jgi:flavodoxin